MSFTSGGFVLLPIAESIGILGAQHSTALDNFEPSVDGRDVAVAIFRVSPGSLYSLPVAR